MNRVFEFGADNVLVESVSVVVSGGQVGGGTAEFRRDNGNVVEGAKSRLESLACDVIKLELQQS